MRKQDQLPALIKSLNKQEKRYFKLYASLQAGNKNFIHLFDELVKADVYTPAVVAKKLGLSLPLLGHTKNYLQEVLLSALQLYEQDRNMNLLLINQGQQARILYNRKQYELAYTINEKALEKALAYDNFWLAQNMLALKYNLLIFLQRYDQAPGIAQQVGLALKQQQEITELLQINTSFSDYANELAAKRSVKGARENPLLQMAPKNLKSNSARILWHEAKQNYYYYVKRNLKTAIKHNLGKLALYKAHPELIYSWPNAYLISLGYLSSHYAELADYENALLYSLQMEQETKDNRKDIPANMCREMNLLARCLQLYQLCLADRYSHAADMGATLQREKKRLALNYYILAQHYYALALFYTGKYDEALGVCEELQSLNTETYMELLFSNKLLLVMLHYELKNYSLLPYLINSAATWAKRHKVKPALTNEILKWFRKLNRLWPVANQETAFFNELKMATQTKVLKKYVLELGLNSWCNSKLGSTSSLEEIE